MPVESPATIYVPNIDEKHVATAIQSLKKQFVDSKYLGMRFEAVIDDPPHAITDFANEQDIGLIVIPSHGHTGIKRLLIGSVAERVVRLAHCPVLVLRD